MTARSIMNFYALVSLTFVLIWPQAALANSFDGLEVLVVGMVVGIPYAIVLLVLGIIGIVFISKNTRRPGYAKFLLIGPPIISGIYLLIFSFQGFDYFVAHLVFSAPAFLLTFGVAIIGHILKKKSSSIDTVSKGAAELAEKS
ncbi:MAG: hypothetical protein JRJ87_23930 [Deltaproteobacteria bacterium]|nr:hypothetical protein [Deltaproteobacteria bacterium]